VENEEDKQMRGTFILSVLLFLGFMAWRLTERLSADALGLATGVFLGVLAGVPVALLVLAATRRRSRDDEDDEDERYASKHGTQYGNQYGMQPAQPPVIILSGYPQGGQQQAPYANNFPTARMLPGESEIVDARRFHVVGEEEEMVEEW
jgi:hypothetical protein